MSKTYQELAPNFALIRARLMQLLHKHPEGLTYERAHAMYFSNFGHRAKTDNRLRELVSKGWATKRVVRNRMTFFANKEGVGGEG